MSKAYVSGVRSVRVNYLLKGAFLIWLGHNFVHKCETMGSCQSQEAQEQLARNKAIEKQLNQDKRTGSSIVKLLLLGSFSFLFSFHFH